MLRITSLLILAGLAPAYAQNRAWTGELHPEGTTETVRPDDAPQSLEDVAARLADVQLSLEAERDFEGAHTALRELWMQVARLEPFPGQQEALVRVALARSELLERLGDLEAASEALRRLLPAEGFTTPRGTWVVKPAVAELVRVVVEAQADARLVKHLEALEARQRGPETNLAARPHFADPRVRAYVEEHFGLPSVEMDQVVLEQMKRGLGNVQIIGLRAAPTLAALVLSDPGDDRRASEFNAVDPLYALLTIDALGGAQLVADNLDAGGDLWRLRILGSLNSLHSVLKGRHSWEEVLGTLFRDPQGRSRIFDSVSAAYGYDRIRGSLLSALTEQASDPNSTSQTEVYQLMAGREDPVPSARTVYVAALSHPDKSLRQLGAQHLLNLEETATELRRFANSTYIDERGWALDTLLDSKDSLDASERQLLSKFLRDPEAAIRRRAVYILVNQLQPFPAEVYVEAANDEDPTVLRELAVLKNVDGETQRAVLLRLADSTSRTVLEAIDHRLRSVSWLEDTGLLPVLEKRFADPVHPFPTDPVYPFPTGDGKGFQLKQYVESWVAKTPEGRRACVRMGLASGRKEALRAALAESYGTYSSGNKYPKCEALLELEPQEIAAFFEWAHHEDPGIAEELMEGFVDLEGTPVAAFENLARTPQAHRLARVRAATIVAELAPDRSETVALEILRDDSWNSSPPYWRESQALETLAEAIPTLSSFVIEVLDDPSLVDPVALTVAGAAANSGLLTDELALRILNRWLEEPHKENEAVHHSLAHLATMSAESVDPTLVIRAAYVPEYAESALRAMGTLRHAEYLPVLDRVLQGSQYLSPLDVDYDDLRKCAVESLTRYLSDDAARILVEGLSQANKSLADRIRASLAVIRDYHQERTYWERQSKVLPSRDEAIAELLAMLDAPEEWLRADAAKGLASFGALEAIPRLIRLRADESETVVAAASKALDHLHALAEHEQASAGGD